MKIITQTIPVDCPDCGWTGNAPAEIVGETAYWVCPTTQCDRGFMDPMKTTDWFYESPECDNDRQGER